MKTINILSEQNHFKFLVQQPPTIPQSVCIFSWFSNIYRFSGASSSPLLVKEGAVEERRWGRRGWGGGKKEGGKNKGGEKENTF